MKVFSKKKMYTQISPALAFLPGADWADLCDGKPVHNGRIDGYTINDSWCIEVPDAVEDAEKKERKDLWATLNACDWKSAFEQAANGRCVVPLRLTDKPPKHPHYVIAIECTGDITFAKMFVDDKLVKVTSAKRNPADKFNWRIGAQTAFERLWTKKKPKHAVREVRRRAKPGEWVKIVAGDACNEDYKIGDVLQIVRKSGCETDVAYYKDEIGKLLWDWEYVVLEGYKPE